MDYIDSILFINKPKEWTSFDVVKKVRSKLKIKKVGHAGTLDPLATGLIILATGKKTKEINTFMKMEKEYVGTFTLGATTPSFDLESEPENFKDFEHLTTEEIKKACLGFIGKINQVPPIYSAIKKNGKPVYLMARKGIEFELEARPIEIFSFEITKIELPILTFKVLCSSGTYIRSLANDFGVVLGCGAYMSSLCRTKIGNYQLEDAIEMKNFME